MFAGDTVVRLHAGLRRYLFMFLDPHSRFVVVFATGGFTFEVQQMVSKNLGGRLVVEALAGGIIVRLDQACKVLLREGGQVGLAGQGPAQAPDGIFDPTLLPGRMRITEKRLEAEGMEVVMPGELGAVIEGDGLPPCGGQRSQQDGQDRGDGGGLPGGRAARGRRWAMKAAALRPLARRRPRLLLAWGR